MARDFIPVNRSLATATQASVLIDYKETLRRAIELGLKCRDIMSHNNDGTNFLDIETLFGLPTGKGQAVFDLVNGSIGAMEGTFQNSDAKTVIEIIG